MRRMYPSQCVAWPPGTLLCGLVGVPDEAGVVVGSIVAVGDTALFARSGFHCWDMIQNGCCYSSTEDLRRGHPFFRLPLLVEVGDLQRVIFDLLGAYLLALSIFSSLRKYPAFLSNL
jgi:hypothetical protein